MLPCHGQKLLFPFSPSTSTAITQDRQSTYTVTLRRIRVNYFCCGKAVTITYSERVFVHVSSMQCACAVLSSVACLALTNVSTLSHKQHNFWTMLLNTKRCVMISSTSFFWNISHSKKKKWAMYTGLHVMYLLFLPDFDETWIFSTGFQELPKYQI
jgi:hypothetical protein